MQRSTSIKRRALLLAVVTALLLFNAAGCALVPEKQDSVEVLQLTVAYQQFQLTQQALEATIAAQAVAPTPQPQIITATAPAPITTIAPAPPPSMSEPAITPPVVPPPDDGGDLEAKMKEARILLYEDMVGQPKVRRYVKETLQNMGLQFEDVGNAVGRLKERLVFGGEGGLPYDLIILAMENRWDPSISGEFYEYLQKNMDRGASVIIEAWMLDKISEGKAKSMLDQCGVSITNYTGGVRNEMDMVLWPTGTGSAVLTEPNNYPKLTRPIFYWSPSDLGDLMELNGMGDAQLLIGRKAGETQKYGVVAVCMGGQMTLQTFSSHSYYLEPMMNIWENYIHNALKARFMGPEG